jgi:hypothetical protein
MRHSPDPKNQKRNVGKEGPPVLLQNETHVVAFTKETSWSNSLFQMSVLLMQHFFLIRNLKASY